MITQLEPELRDFARSLLKPRPTESVAEWCERNVIFDEAEYRGPFQTRRAEYIREPLNDFANRNVSDEVLCWGSQTKKTGTLIGGVAWCLVNDPCGVFWVMPTVALARKFSRERLQRLMRKSVPHLIPVVELRHGFTLLDMTLDASQITLTGSNSPASLSSTPARRIILDEVDKFDEGGRGEADAVSLAEQRCKNIPFPQRWKTSTPTLYTGLIWQEFLKGNQMRNYLPCYHCKKLIIFAWSKQFTVFKLNGDEAFVKWDAGARNKSTGTWDLDRVRQSAHAVCPHCAGEIRDGHKTSMIRDGRWIATNLSASPSFISRHLPSMYSNAPETTFGRMAVKFIESKKSASGLQGFINGDLAEPYQSQDTVEERVKLITNRVAVEVKAEWKKVMTVDCQRNFPHFWYVARAWNGRDSEGFAAGAADTWEDLRSIQTTNGIADVCVAIDSGYGAKDDSEVYLNCARYSEIADDGNGKAQCLGWIPTKGMPSRKRWKDDASGLYVPWYLSSIDPFSDTADAGQCRLSLLEFAAEFFKDLLSRFRSGDGGIKWSVTSAVATDEYWRHLNAWKREDVRDRFSTRTVTKWIVRDSRWPDHLADCEVLQLVVASFHGFFSID